jgi:hypothetical protein
LCGRADEQTRLCAHTAKGLRHAASLNLLVTPLPDGAARRDAPPEGEGVGEPGGALAQAPPPPPRSLQSEMCASSWAALWAALRACACARCVALVARTLVAPPPDAPLPGVL